MSRAADPPEHALRGVVLWVTRMRPHYLRMVKIAIGSILNEKFSSFVLIRPIVANCPDNDKGR
jgi:hypothetical protein